MCLTPSMCLIQRDLRDSDVDVVTLGQYLRPSRRHMSVQRYVPPEVSNGVIRIAYIHTFSIHHISTVGVSGLGDDCAPNGFPLCGSRSSCPLVLSSRGIVFEGCAKRGHRGCEAAAGLVISLIGPKFEYSNGSH